MPVNPSPQIWPANSTLDLVNVPWDNTYRNVVRFTDRAALDSYIDSLSGSTTQPGKRITGMSYLRADQPIMLEDPFNNLWKYNYVRVSNPPQPVEEGDPEDQRSFYYFITGVRHVAPNTTEITVQLDVYQTFIYGADFGESYVERGHVAIAQQGQMDDNGRRYLTSPEGLDTGESLTTLKQYQIADSLITDRSDVVLYSTSDLTSGDWGTPEAPNTPGPANNVLSFGVGSGVSVYVIRGSQVNAFFNGIQDYPWIAQTIIAAYLVPNLTNFYPDYTYPPAGTDTPLADPPVSAAYAETQVRQVMPGNWRDLPDIVDRIPTRYRHLNKFKVWPFLSLECDYMADNTVTLRPEQFYTSGVHMGVELSAQLSDAQMRVYPFRYNIVDSATWSFDEVPPGFPETVELHYDAQHFVTTGALPRLGVANDTAALMLASSAYSRSFQSDNADYTRDLAQRQAGRSFDSAGMAIESAREATRLGNQFASEQQAQAANWATDDAWRNGIIGTVQGVAGGAVMGKGAGVAAGAIGGVAAGALSGWQTSINNERSALTTAQQNAQNSALTANALGNQITDKDANLSLALYAARGNYQQTIGAIEASVHDTKTIAPSMVAMPQGSLSVAARGQLVARLTIKAIGTQRMNAIGNYWLRYGYAIGEYMPIPRDTMVMDRFTYWKMAECTLMDTHMPENFKDTLRGIFEKGVTVWRNPDEIGDTFSANAPITGEYYG